MEELTDRPDLNDDMELIREQADRCRDILRSMGRAGKDDLHLKRSPLTAMIREAAEPHEDRGVRINYDIAPRDGADARQPVVERRPEIIHGLRNLVQNAVDFAREEIWIDVRWAEDEISIRIIDDGPGFPVQVLGRIGNPFVRQRRSPRSDAQRPEYEGMGLGLFIAKTLLERSGAELSFANGHDPLSAQQAPAERGGAIVDAVWPREAIAVADDSTAAGLGQNQPIKA